MFTIVGSRGAVGRDLIRERVKAGLRNAVARGARLGRPKKIVNHVRIAKWRAEGIPWKEVAKRADCSIMTAMAALRSNNPLPN